MEGAHGVQALHHRSGGAAAIISQTFIYILTAVAIALPTWEIVDILRTHLHSFRVYNKMLIYT